MKLFYDKHIFFCTNLRKENEKLRKSKPLLSRSVSKCSSQKSSTNEEAASSSKIPGDSFSTSSHSTNSSADVEEEDESKGSEREDTFSFEYEEEIFYKTWDNEKKAFTDKKFRRNKLV